MIAAYGVIENIFTLPLSTTASSLSVLGPPADPGLDFAPLAWSSRRIGYRGDGQDAVIVDGHL
jgi:hypothetical protein